MQNLNGWEPVTSELVSVSFPPGKVKDRGTCPVMSGAGHDLYTLRASSKHPFKQATVHLGNSYNLQKTLLKDKPRLHL